MRRRSTAADLAVMDAQIEAALVDYAPQTIRQLFYRLTNPRLAYPAEKSDSGYQLVARRLNKMRLAGRVAWSDIVDSSRSALLPQTFCGPEDVLAAAARAYKTDPWLGTEYIPQVWVESRSLAGILAPTCAEWRVPLYPSGGFTSHTMQYDAALSMAGEASESRFIGQAIYIGDYDPAGVLIPESISDFIQARLLEMGGGVEFSLNRIAVNESQIEAYDLPAKPRKASERRRPDVRETVEAEAMRAEDMIGLLESELSAMLPVADLRSVKAGDDIERERIASLGAMLPAMSNGAGAYEDDSMRACARCGGQVLTSYEESVCVQCGFTTYETALEWRPRAREWTVGPQAPGRPAKRRARGKQITCGASGCRRQFVQWRAGHRYCSAACGNAERRRVARGELTARACLQCGGEFTPIRTTHVYCGRKCNNQAIGVRRRRGTTAGACTVCGAEFESQRGARRIYCGRKCYDKARRPSKRLLAAMEALL